MNRPLVSVIIPVLNGERFLAAAVSSIRRQRYPNLEIIVVDDGSTDGTVAVANALGGEVKCLSQANGGPPSARNHGLEVAQGRLIGFLDADDLWSDDKLDVQVDRLHADPELDVVMGTTQVCRPTATADAGALGEPAGPPALLLSLGSALFRREVFERVGRFDASQRMDDDVDWFLRALEAGIRILPLNHVVQYYRRHDRNITNARDVDRRFFLLALKKSLDRRRGRGETPTAFPAWPESRDVSRG
ncbi:MAG: glycosyltransferase family 2 protein [Chloroflexota bacterium]|nr:glycosyltransferase family 2 protein [Chloroflexota bacterium]